MSNPVFPTMDKSQDSKFYEKSLEDPSMQSEMDGGYVVSRAKHTRKPRRSYKTGFSSILNADRIKLENFYDSVRGGSVIFDWVDPVSGDTIQVLFADKLSFKYVGVGAAQLWDVTISLKQP
ncbi:hypothetical protein QN372_00505 [Undibacterium sp. RTI2.1]|uniref:hypothetical protein n=1 Tax=unclassified Undibacterium TaxID=2630295 RepID=UPI002AB450A8|nr:MULTISPECIES: hypothetical protein [unclassified Undibacterium]MDY7537619.1 hypothetical protein [Undibacterium sp. 5I1]MEB0029220.1 hypothetical protein [Undibacterium sp. RTI2.1]MEB0115528.1 hypothetical protein [Undibacterium sp. RTI2.2]MEB0230164.1 hypothetical protein [Undibacterium sp. 10I3]MEB0256356.1 hypothetical protein [Undibacterium sp. 5I1]